MRKVALYARVSTKNNGQDPETQLVALREYVTARGLNIAEEYVDIGISGAKDRRPELERLMQEARRRRFDAVLVARFDRFARSVRHLVMALDEFNSLCINFISLSESIDTSTPMGKMVFTVIGAVAELERSLIQERVVMGLKRAKTQGKKLGRPEVQVNLKKAQKLRAEGLSYRDIGKELSVSHTKVRQLLNGNGN
jgi:DNA invertase Pin-like site-specific DNA recombinase